MQIVFVDPDNKTKWFEFEDNLGFIDDAISDNLDTFDGIARECGVAVLSDFIADYIEENPYEFGLGGEWFSVEAGLKSVNAIIKYLQCPQDAGKSKAVARKARKMEAWIVAELQNLQERLALAANQSRGAKFKLVLLKIVEGYPVVAMAPKVLSYP